MNFLIDTQVLIWVQENNSALSKRARALLSDSTNTVCVSQVSLFEIAIKLKIGKLPSFQITLNELIQQVENDNFQLLGITNSHLITYDKIPFFDDHRDPFDRLILATALAERIPIISADEKFARYRDVVELIW